MDDTMQRRMVDTAQRGDSLNGEILPPGPPWHTRRAPARSPPLPSTTSAWVITWPRPASTPRTRPKPNPRPTRIRPTCISGRS